MYARLLAALLNAAVAHTAVGALPSYDTVMAWMVLIVLVILAIGIVIGVWVFWGPR